MVYTKVTFLVVITRNFNFFLKKIVKKSFKLTNKNDTALLENNFLFYLFFTYLNFQSIKSIFLNLSDQKTYYCFILAHCKNISEC